MSTYRLTPAARRGVRSLGYSDVGWSDPLGTLDESGWLAVPVVSGLIRIERGLLVEIPDEPGDGAVLRVYIDGGSFVAVRCDSEAPEDDKALTWRRSGTSGAYTYASLVTDAIAVEVIRP